MADGRMVVYNSDAGGIPNVYLALTLGHTGS